MTLPARLRIRPGRKARRGQWTRCDALRLTSRGWVRCATAAHRILGNGTRLCIRCYCEVKDG